jgi:hypothetical protein
MVNFPPRPTPPPSGSATYVGNGGSVQTTPAAAILAAQFAGQLNGVATVTTSGSIVSIIAAGGLPEASYDSLTVVLPVNQTVSISAATIGTVRPNGTIRPLGPAGPTATAVLNRAFAAKCAATKTAALQKGQSNFEVSVPKASTIDVIGSLLGPDGDTANLEKQVYSMTFNTAGGAVVAGTDFQPPVLPTAGGGGTYVYDPYSG